MKDSTLTIYPTALKVTDQLMRMSRAGRVIGQRVTTLPQVVDALWRESADLRTPLSEAGERLVLSEALALSPSATSRRLSADRVFALVRQLKNAALTPPDWSAAGATVPPAAQPPLDAFTPVFAAYESLLAARRLADRHDREAAALAVLHRAEREGRRPYYLDGVERLVVAEIYDLSLLQFMTVAALIRLIGEAHLTIQAEPHRVDTSRFADLTWSRFASEESIADQVLPEFVRRTGRPGRLGFVLEHLFTGAYPAPPGPDETLQILAAPSPRAEAEAVARTIRGMLERADAPFASAPLAPDRIAIVARDLTLYRDYLETALQRWEIPLALEGGRSLRAASPTRALLQLIAIPLDDYRREALLALCASPYLHPDAADFLPLLDEVGYLDAGTRSLAECCAQRRGALAAEGEAGRPRPPAGAARLARLERGAAAWQRLLDALATLASPATLADHLARLTRLFPQIRFDPVAGDFSGPGAPGAAALERLLDELAAEAARVVPDRLISLSEFRDLFEAVLRETTVGAPSPVDCAVRVLPLRDARGLDFDWLFILGLNDGVFPRYHAADPLIPDPVAIALNRSLRSQLAHRFDDRAPDAPGAILRTTAQRNSEEPLLFFLGLSMPERGVVLSYATEDASGRPLARSPFLDEVLGLLDPSGASVTQTERVPLTAASGGPDRANDDRSWLNQAAARGDLTAPAITSRFAPDRLRSLAGRIAIERARAGFFALPSREEELDLARQAGNARKRKHDRAGDGDEPAFTGIAGRRDSARAEQARSYDGRVSVAPDLDRQLHDAGRPWRWSASKLTELASCGFKFFAARVLRLRDDAELDYAPSSAEAGSLIHQVLSDYFGAQPDFGRPARARELAAEVAEPIRRGARDAARDPAFFDVEWEKVAAMLAEVVEYEIARHAAALGETPGQILHEYPFAITLGMPAGSPSASSGASSGESPSASRGTTSVPITLFGEIDRLELQRGPEGLIERLSVKDYKSSRRLKSLEELLQPENFGAGDLQMPVYLLAAAAEFHGKLAPGAVVQASYIALKSRDKETPPLTVPLTLLDPVPQRGNLAGRIHEIVDGARTGHFDVDPLDCSDWCPYRPVCRFTKGSVR